MAAPSGPAVPPSPAGGGSVRSLPPDESVRTLLSASRTLALLLALVAGLLFLILLAFTVLDVVFGRGAGDIVGAVYCLASAAVNYVLWREIPRLEQLAAGGQYPALRDSLLIWGILGLVFFVVVGVLLLVAWIRVELLVHPRPG
jgi:hypothetical protein